MIFLPLLGFGMFLFALPGAKQAVTIGLGTDYLLTKLEGWTLERQIRLKLNTEELHLIKPFTIDEADVRGVFFSSGPDEAIRKKELCGTWILTPRERLDFERRVRNDMLVRQTGPVYDAVREVMTDEQQFTQMLDALRLHNAGYFEDLRALSKLRAEDKILKIAIETSRVEWEKARKQA